MPRGKTYYTNERTNPRIDPRVRAARNEFERRYGCGRPYLEKDPFIDMSFIDARRGEPLPLETAPFIEETPLTSLDKRILRIRREQQEVALPLEDQYLETDE